MRNLRGRTVDGSESSLGALDWAADTVGRAGRIHAVVGLNPWTRYVADGVAGREVSFQEALERDLVTDWTAEVRFPCRRAGTTVERLDGCQGARRDRHRRPRRRDRGRCTHLDCSAMPARVGRTINHLIRITDHPVVVVPGRHRSGLDDGVVVVGIGHGNATRAAVRWAAHLARGRRLTVELLHATGDAPVFQADGVLDLVRYEVGQHDPDEWQHGAIEHFAELMQTLAGPELDLVVSTPPGLAALRLDEASERSALLVLGRHRSVLDRGHHTAQPLRHALDARPLSGGGDRGSPRLAARRVGHRRRSAASPPPEPDDGDAPTPREFNRHLAVVAVDDPEMVFDAAPEDRGGDVADRAIPTDRPARAVVGARSIEHLAAGDARGGARPSTARSGDTVTRPGRERELVDERHPPIRVHRADRDLAGMRPAAMTPRRSATAPTCRRVRRCRPGRR